jgi:single-strand DNA-binding protein
MIKLQVIGNLGKDCVTNAVNGKNVINFSVAHTERYKDAQGNPQERTTWVDCSYWTERLGIAPYLKKGQMVYVEGTPEVKTFSRNDGSAGASLVLRIQSVQLLGGGQRSEGDNQGSTQVRGQLEPQKAEVVGVQAQEDDLPF